jgi:DinB superfamily
MVDIAGLIMEAKEARARLLDRVRVLSSAQGAFKPDPVEWSIAENVEHLVLAEQGAVNRVWAAADGLRRGQPVWTGEPIHRGKSMEQIVTETWVPGQQAPDIATPRRRGPLAYWILAIECNQPMLDAVQAALAELDPAEVVTPHPISGPWDAGQWLAFVRFHLDLHRQQIEHVMRAPGFPKYD